MLSLNVIGISGSPRRKGNTDTLVTEILAGAEEAGATTSMVYLDELNIHPCKGCFACSKTHQCIQEDDMKAVATQLEQSVVWVLGTPIYWWGPSAQFKAFLDRWVSISRSTFRGKQAIVAIPMGGGSESYAQHTVAMFEDVFQYLGINHCGTILAPGSDGRDSVRNSPSLLEKARKLGMETTKKL